LEREIENLVSMFEARTGERVATVTLSAADHKVRVSVETAGTTPGADADPGDQTDERPL
jgi:hypothetical protein